MIKQKKSLLAGAAIAAMLLSGCTLYTLFGSSGPTASDSLAGSTSGISSASMSLSGETSLEGDYEKHPTSYKSRDWGESVGLNYLPSTGTQKLLVIPVVIKDYASNATADKRSDIIKTFSGEASETGWQSLRSFYAASSFGKLNLDVTVSDWYALGLTTSQIVAKNDPNGTGAEGVEYVVNQAVAWYKANNSSTFAQFDGDGDGYLDGVWIVYSAPDYSVVTSLDSTFWAFTSWTSNYPSLSSPTANTYGWASYDFMYEGYGTSAVDAHTFIHETGHMLGLDDYYSYSDDHLSAPMGCIDMMDYNIIDHNAYSKFALGWVEPYLIDHAGTLTLRPSEETGDCAIIPTAGGWNGHAFDEYIMIEYYTPTGLNEKDASENYAGKYPKGFSRNGIRIYHVDSRLCKISVNGSSYTYGPYIDSVVSSNTTGTLVANSNTYGYGYMDAANYHPSLIQEMDCQKKRNFAKTVDNSKGAYDATFATLYLADDTSLFTSGTSFSLSSYSSSFIYGSSGKMNDGTSLPYKLDFSGGTSAGITVAVSAV